MIKLTIYNKIFTNYNKILPIIMMKNNKKINKYISNK
jgi:hypothetical protein